MERIAFQDPKTQERTYLMVHHAGPGACYASALHTAAVNPERQLMVVHGSVRRVQGGGGLPHGHAWLKLQHQGTWWVLDPSGPFCVFKQEAAYLRSRQAEAIAEYTPREAKALFDQSGDEGPWDRRVLALKHRRGVAPAH